MEEEQVLHISPYVAQIEKFADSLTQLSHTFLQMENKKKTFTNEEIDAIFDRVRERVCAQCEKREWCWGDNFVHTYQMGYEILSAVDNYGNELNMEVKRKLQQCCIMAPRFLRETLDAFHSARQNMMWTNRMAMSREGCAIQMDTFAEMIRLTAKEMEDSIFTDEWLEKRIIAALKKKNVRVLYTNFFMNPEGKYEVQVTARSMGEGCVTVKEIAREVSRAAGRRLVPAGMQSQVVGREYVTVVCMEGPEYSTLQGVARIGKDGNLVSGDNYMMIDLPGGRQAFALSDGMGSARRRAGRVRWSSSFWRSFWKPAFRRKQRSRCSIRRLSWGAKRFITLRWI
jgi:stage II sporulation protein E